jgi:hypothetical protein
MNQKGVRMAADAMKPSRVIRGVYLRFMVPWKKNGADKRKTGITYAKKWTEKA